MADEKSTKHAADVWSRGEVYEGWIGRWSPLVAREFLPWLAVPPHSDWLDVGSGTGAPSQTILELAKPKNIKGVDSSEGYVNFAKARISDPRVTFEMADAQALPEVSDSYDVAVSGLVINFVPQPEKAVSEMRRVVRLGGVVATYLWDLAGEMQIIRRFWDAAIALDPAALELDEGRRFPLCKPGPLQRLFEGAGLHSVETRAIDIHTDFKDFDDFWAPFLGGQGPAPAYAMSLSEEHRVVLRERLRTSLPIATDGSIPLIARAWAVRGLK